MRVDLGGRLALISGKNEISRAVAERLAENGARVVSRGEDGDVAGLLRGGGRLDMHVNCGTTNGIVEEEQAIVAAMRASGGGRIVTVISVGGLVPVVGYAAQAASGAGMVARMRATSLELARHGILVNAVATACGPAELDARVIGHCPLARAPRLAEITNAVLFLVAPANSYMTGHVLALDGGWTAGFARDF